MEVLSKRKIVAISNMQGWNDRPRAENGERSENADGATKKFNDEAKDFLIRGPLS